MPGPHALPVRLQPEFVLPDREDERDGRACPQLLHRHGASARTARARRKHDRAARRACSLIRQATSV